MKRLVSFRTPLQLVPGLMVVFLCILASPVLADPPALVGRLNFIRGTVSFQPDGVDDWSTASLNYPLSTGDRFWVDEDSSAEFHIGSTAVQVAHRTDFSVLQLTDDVRQFSLTQGSVAIRIRHLDDEDVFEVDTPNGAITFLRPGLYRVDVDSDGDTSRVIVRNGQAEVTDEGSAFTVNRDEEATVYGGDQFSYDIDEVPGLDSFDRFAEGRDRHEDGVIAEERDLSPYMTGYEDLGAYGRWQDSPGYGRVWYPTGVAAGWAPYRYGHWAWVAPWGWTWVDDAPWGFAPFHYGRWAYVGGGWAWVPGTYVARPVYAPALVAFVGGGVGVSAGFVVGGGPGVGWFPLGPREVYVPAYRVSPVYVQRVNVVNVNVTNINVTNVRYVNREVPGAVTAVPQNVFVGARPVAVSAVAVSSTQVASVRVVGQTAPIVPTRVSVLASASVSTTTRIAAPPAKLQTVAIVAKTPPPPPAAKFEVRRQAMLANPGKPLDPQVESQLAKQQGNVSTVREKRVKSATVQTGNQSLKPKRAGITEVHPATTTTTINKGQPSTSVKSGQQTVTGQPNKSKKDNLEVTGGGKPKDKEGKKHTGTETGQPTSTVTTTKPKTGGGQTGGQGDKNERKTMKTEPVVTPTPKPKPKEPVVTPTPRPTPKTVNRDNVKNPETTSEQPKNKDKSDKKDKTEKPDKKPKGEERPEKPPQI
ncbi:MAG TPA: DUF6600 domain-containing protein [Blastocatellia bacterium]|nr:DUF6600 domain-containing protein [Blastocatellia bacterium]